MIKNPSIPNVLGAPGDHADEEDCDVVKILDEKPWLARAATAPRDEMTLLALAATTKPPSFFGRPCDFYM